MRFTRTAPQAAPEIGSGNRVAYLDGIRGLAILAVIAVHWGQRIGNPFPGGYIGVDIFFVLSGFVITTILLKRPTTYRRFLQRRVQRLYPALLGLLVGGVLLAALLPEAAVEPRDAWRGAAVALTQGSSLWAAQGHPNPLFGITWSLSCEWLFYLAWPPALAVIVRRWPHDVWRVVLAGAFGLYAVALWLPASWFYFAPVSRSAELLVGAALAAAVRRPVLRSVPGPVLVVAAAGIAGWLLLGTSEMAVQYKLLGMPIAVAATAAFIWHGRARPRGAVSRLLGLRPLRGIGLVSYSAYLWHALPLAILPAGAFGLARGALAAAGIVAAMAATAISYTLLERPFTRAARPGGPMSSGPQPRDSAVWSQTGQ